MQNQSIKDKIIKLEKEARKLHTEHQQRDLWSSEVRDYTNQFIDKLTDSIAFESSADEGKGIYDLDIEEGAVEMSAILGGIENNIDNNGINAASGGHLAYIPGGGLYPAALGDYLAAITNNYAGVYYGSPGAVRLENMLIRWMCRTMGFPENASGNLTSGGSIANLIALVTAREVHEIKARDIEYSVIYLSEQAHHSFIKAIRISGLSEAVIRYIPLDDRLRISPEALEKMIVDDINAGLKPFYINSSFGTTNTGAIDPMKSLSTISKKYKLWLHVDGAYGGFFKLVNEVVPMFEGIQDADSITLDPHKTLFLPYGSGAILIRDKNHSLKAFQQLADYMQDTVDADEEISPADVSLEQTKHFRGLRMWLPLKLFGLKPFRAALEEKLYLTRYFYREIKNEKGFEVGPEPELSVGIFRYIPENQNANLFNQKLINLVNKDGRIFLSSTNIDGIFWIRIAVVSFRTHLRQIELLLEILRKSVKKLKGETYL